MQFHVLSFEGPDGYARAGGVASRVSGLTESLAGLGFETHLWFVGDPGLPGYEERRGVDLHRWCQWISHYHPGGVYEGEEGKQLDYGSSLPPHLFEKVLIPRLQAGERAVVLAEEWHTVDAVLHLDWLLRRSALRERVKISWNANNTFGFDRIDWTRLREAAIITTVSRYMRQLMRGFGVDAVVVPNGLSPDAFHKPDREAISELQRRLRGRTLLGKVARWDPDKNWLLAVAIVAELKRHGWRPLLVARGGVEPHGVEVIAAARAAGLDVVEREMAASGARGLLDALDAINGADVVVLRSPLDDTGRRILFRAASAVLANSAHEPFGLVGLETMAAYGVACTGYSGEDYAVPGRNALVMQTSSPKEFVALLRDAYAHRASVGAIRRAARQTAKQYAWPEIIGRVLLPRLSTTEGQ